MLKIIYEKESKVRAASINTSYNHLSGNASLSDGPVRAESLLRTIGDPCASPIADASPLGLLALAVRVRPRAD